MEKEEPARPFAEVDRELSDRKGGALLNYHHNTRVNLSDATLFAVVAARLVPTSLEVPRYPVRKEPRKWDSNSKRPTRFPSSLALMRAICSRWRSAPSSSRTRTKTATTWWRIVPSSSGTSP